jgi:hypothetical protein
MNDIGLHQSNISSVENQNQQVGLQSNTSIQQINSQNNFSPHTVASTESRSSNDTGNGRSQEQGININPAVTQNELDKPSYPSNRFIRKCVIYQFLLKFQLTRLIKHNHVTSFLVNCNNRHISNSNKINIIKNNINARHNIR